MRRCEAQRLIILLLLALVVYLSSVIREQTRTIILQEQTIEALETR